MSGIHNVFSAPFNSDKVLRGGGTLVIGARKSDVNVEAGGFIQHFNGSLSAVNIWNKLLTADEVLKLYRACHLQRGNLLYWCEHVIRPMLRNDVPLTSPSTACSSSRKSDRNLRAMNRGVRWSFLVPCQFWGGRLVGEPWKEWGEYLELSIQSHGFSFLTAPYLSQHGSCSVFPK